MSRFNVVQKFLYIKKMLKRLEPKKVKPNRFHSKKVSEKTCSFFYIIRLLCETVGEVGVGGVGGDLPSSVQPSPRPTHPSSIV